MRYRIKQISGNWGSPKYVVESKAWWHIKWSQVGKTEDFLKAAVHQLERAQSVKTRIMKRKEW